MNVDIAIIPETKKKKRFIRITELCTNLQRSATKENSFGWNRNVIKDRMERKNTQL